MVELDGLRTVLAVAIVAYHVGVPGLHAGVLALPTFFAMSGFLITNGLLAEHRRAGRIALARFARSRLLRIGTPRAVLVGRVALLWPLVSGWTDPDTDLATAAAIALTSTTNLARLAGLRQGVLDPIWSLAAEEQFYLLWPLVVAAARRRGHWTPATQHRTLWAGLVSLGAIVTLFPTDWKGDPISILVLMPAAAIASTALIAGLEHPRTALAPVLRWRPLVWFGANAPYSLYLWHVVVLAAMLQLGDGAVARGAALAISIGVGALLGLVVEQPMARLRRRLDAGPRIERGHAR